MVPVVLYQYRFHYSPLTPKVQRKNLILILIFVLQRTKNTVLSWMDILMFHGKKLKTF